MVPDMNYHTLPFPGCLLGLMLCVHKFSSALCTDASNETSRGVNKRFFSEATMVSSHAYIAQIQDRSQPRACTAHSLTFWPHSSAPLLLLLLPPPPFLFSSRSQNELSTRGHRALKGGKLLLDYGSPLLTLLIYPEPCQRMSHYPSQTFKHLCRKIPSNG
eukprot:scaffold2968_cov172-Amphora_coffeaeformis.AAC.3